MTIRKLLNYWFQKKRSGFYVFLSFCCGFVYFAGVLLRSRYPDFSPLLKQAGFVAFTGVILAFFIHLNLHSSHWFLEHFKDTDHLPKKQIALVNSFCMTLFLSFSLAILPVVSLCLDPLWNAIGRWFSSRTTMEKTVYPAVPVQTESPMSPDLSALLGEARPPAPWISFLDKIVRTAGAILIILLMILAVRRLFLVLWAWITKPRQLDGDEKIYLTPTWSLNSAKKIIQQQTPKRLFGSYNEKIRQKYRKKILFLARKKKKHLCASSSPQELEQAVGLEYPALHDLYEKARYSHEECTRSDWETL